MNEDDEFMRAATVLERKRAWRLRKHRELARKARDNPYLAPIVQSRYASVAAHAEQIRLEEHAALSQALAYVEQHARSATRAHQRRALAEKTRLRRELDTECHPPAEDE